MIKLKSIISVVTVSPKWNVRRWMLGGTFICSYPSKQKNEWLETLQKWFETLILNTFWISAAHKTNNHYLFNRLLCYTTFHSINLILQLDKLIGQPNPIIRFLLSLVNKFIRLPRPFAEQSKQIIRESFWLHR